MNKAWKSRPLLILVILLSLWTINCKKQEKIAAEQQRQVEFTPPRDIQNISWITEAWPEFTQEDGTGIYHDVINAIFSAYDLEIEVTYSPWKRAVDQVQAGNYDMTGGILKSDNFYQSKYPIYEYNDLVIFKKGAFEWEGIDTLKDKTGVWVRGYIDEEADRPILQIARGQELPSFEEVFLFFLKGRADYLLTEKEAFKNYSAQIEDFDQSQYEMIYFASGQLFFSFPKNERGLRIKDLYDRGVERLGQNTLNEIYEQWGLSAPIYEF